MSSPLTSEYVHITEAVKRYEKTRQTFYNYINKNLIKTVKRNNKTYLAVKDIEALLSESIAPEVAPTSQTVGTTVAPKSFPSSDVLVLEHVEQTGEEIMQQLRAVKEELILESKHISYQQEQKVVTTITHLLQAQQHKIESIQQFLQTHLSQYKKLRFWFAYICFLVVNIGLIALLP